MKIRTLGALVGLSLYSAPQATAQVNAQLVSPVSSRYFFVTPDTQLPEAMVAGGAGLSFNYSYLPLAFASEDGERPVITELATADLVVHLDLVRRVRLELTLPVNATAGETAMAYAGPGDARASVQIGILEPGHHPLGLALRPFLVLPTGNPDEALGEAQLSPGGYLVAHRPFGGVQVSAALGARRVAPLHQEEARRDQWLASLGVSVPVVGSLRVGAELFGSTPLLEPFQDLLQSPVEALLSVHYAVAPGFDLSLGGGTGITEGVGGPRARGFFQMAAVFPLPGRDRDRDGVADKVDACKTEAEDVDGYMDQDGCPDGDNDQDGIADGVDQCPNNPEDMDDFLDSDGCPEPDNDGDGVADAEDQCPLEREDADTWDDADGCPDRDNDRDGFLDIEDDCPLEAEDFDGFKDLDGCADNDNDGDGFADKADRCPNEPEDANGREDEDGCPDEGGSILANCAKDPDGRCLDKDAPLPVNRRLTLATPVRFALDSAELSSTVRAALDQLVPRLQKLPDGHRLTIAGHCDDLGTDEYNDQLSVRRAESVRAYLAAHGVNEAVLETIGYGRRQPVVRGSSEEARGQNRRVELWVQKGLPKRAVPMGALGMGGEPFASAGKR